MTRATPLGSLALTVRPLGGGRIPHACRSPLFTGKSGPRLNVQNARRGRGPVLNEECAIQDTEKARRAQDFRSFATMMMEPSDELSMLPTHTSTRLNLATQIPDLR